MNSNSSDELSLLELFQKLMPEIGVTQNQLDNPTNDFVPLFYQEFRNKLYLILSEAVKDVEPVEGKRADVDSLYSLVRFINFTTLYVNPNIDSSMTFKLLHYSAGKIFKVHARSLLKVLWNFEIEFVKIKAILFKRFLDSKQLHSKRLELDNLKKKLASNVSEIATNEKVLIDLQKNREKVQVRFKKLSQLQDAEKLTAEKLKAEVKIILEEYDNLQVLVTNINANIEHLNKQVVTEESYKGLLNLKENVTVKCSELKKEEGIIQENLRGKKLDIVRFNALCMHINELNVIVKELLSSHEQYLDQLSKRKYLDKSLKEVVDKMEKLNSSRMQLKDKTKCRKETIQNVICKNSESVESFGQGLLEIREQLLQEKENRERELGHKRNHEKAISNLNRSCSEIKCKIDDVNAAHNHLYQKIIKIENANTESLSNAMLEISNKLKSANILKTTK